MGSQKEKLKNLLPTHPGLARAPAASPAAPAGLKRAVPAAGSSPAMARPQWNSID